MKSISFTVPQDKISITAKTFLRRHCDVSSRLLIKLKQTENGITCNGNHIRVIDTVKSGDTITLNLPDDSSQITPINMPLSIVYEDEHLLVVNKPANMAVHPTGDHIYDTLANAVTYYYQLNSESCAFRALNRLDRDTTGLVLIAKNKFSANLNKKSIHKTYYAICEGNIDHSGIVNAPIDFKPGHIIQREVRVGGANSVTNYTPIQYTKHHTLVSVKLETGRTHQIRVHMSYLGYPLAGDDMYGGNLSFIKRQALHCGVIQLRHPVTNKNILLRSPLPKDMQGALENDK